VSFQEKSLAAVMDEGRHARYRGDPVTANPYADGSPEYAAWKKAWEAPEGDEPKADPDPQAT
jgi:hypothetical protein